MEAAAGKPFVFIQIPSRSLRLCGGSSGLAARGDNDAADTIVPRLLALRLGATSGLSLYLACVLRALRVSVVNHPGQGHDADDEMWTKDPKFRFWPNNRGVNLSKRVKNRTGGGENGTLKLC